MTSHIATPRRRGTATGIACAALLVLSACSPTDILQVRDPDIINPADVQSAAGANAVRLGAIGRLNSATSGGSSASEGLFLVSGMLTDEWNVGDSFVERWNVDSRNVQLQNTYGTDVDRLLQRSRVSAEQAIGLLAQYKPTGPVADVAEMYFVEAYTENALGETYCNGITLSDVANGIDVYGPPMMTKAVFERALAHADSGLTMLTGTTAADVRVRSVLAVIKGRILLNLDRAVEAGAAVAAVPTSYRYQMLYEAGKFDNAIWSWNNSGRNYSVSNNEGVNGLNFATAGDPRVPVCQGGDAVCKANGVTATTKQDQSTPFYVQLVWPTRDASVTIVGGVEARLIEAEAAYRANNYTLMIQKLNQARTEGGVANLPATLVDPGTTAARVDLIFRERAFWLFSTGHRLGDLRRLVKFYSRPAESVFPTGTSNHGTYGPDVNLPVPLAETTNPNITAAYAATGSTCIDRAP